MTIPTFRQIEDRVGRALKEQGGLGVILIDLAPLARIERNFGGGTYQALRAQVDPLILELPERLNEGERHEKSQLNAVLRDHGVAT